MFMIHDWNRKKLRQKRQAPGYLQSFLLLSGTIETLKRTVACWYFFLRFSVSKAEINLVFFYENGNILLLLHLTKQLSVFFKLTPTLHFADFKNSSRFAFRFLFILYKKMKNNKLYYTILCKLKGYKDALLKFSI